MKYFLILIVFLSCSVKKINAQIELPKIFASNMVLPRDKIIPINGKAQPYETIKVTISDQVHVVKADRNGGFVVKLEPMKYGGALRTDL